MGYDPNTPKHPDILPEHVRIRVTVMIPSMTEKDAEELEAYLQNLSKEFPGAIVEFRRYPALYSLLTE